VLELLIKRGQMVVDNESEEKIQQITAKINEVVD
jgi:hypothetical protein